MSDLEMRQTRALESMALNLKAIKATGEKTAQIMAKMQHPAYQGKEIKEVAVLEDDISVAFTFEVPEINGTANFYRQDDGILRVEILVALEEAERFLAVVDELDVKTLQIDAV